ncbi:uncharacterized protein LOC9631413 [Selaginella moellendorffii]|uniref:uncharacterized protein LOC9631413 n=1 Tax=Selaginella moellendorffii TaxID=88036 RepID=UPI000D1CA1D3|nr:uncharacterized protein LOC9631413 [Selaginella moellendorffii]XP_024528981.1 uncharacterized protein LOC9631413 [Selaginella moellendorffii]XP_024528982.1 uncharacterized protein LOC9631413 [Selaginella moellendorffii]XP_024528983.1 uncharacterized protein LOC9631413 [Selaginella moellendorffii]|eukprot:XP_024528980.1 uncharacterized protein LOC9631413 [Selaginella moellendorffii]
MASGRPHYGAGALQRSGMLSKEQLFRLFLEFAHLVDKPEVKKRISDAVQARQEAVGVTTEIQEEIFLRMGVEPKFGIASLGKVNTVYKDDRELMLKFYEFVAREEMACDEAELGRDAFQQKMQQFTKSQEQQLKLLQQLRNLSLDRQQAFFQDLQARMQYLHKQGAPSMSTRDIQDFHQQFLMRSN